MIYSEAREALLQHFVQHWADTTPYALENEPYDPPAGPWVRFSSRMIDFAQSSMGGEGNRKFMRQGMCSVQIFTAKNEGTATLNAFVDLAIGMFEGKRIANGAIWITSAKPKEGLPDKTHISTVVEIMFNFEEVK